ncbi:MAG: hypothetical protein HOQ21_10100 [Dermatophilaceae bacterium]|nr:hypothetical protein [Dermatophilaceae bacterium]
MLSIGEPQPANIETRQEKCLRNCERTFRYIHDATRGEPGDVRYCDHGRVWTFDHDTGHIDVWEWLSPVFNPIRYARAVRALRQRPGTATVQRNADGTRTVVRADYLLAVAIDLLTSALEPDVIEPDGTLRLDTAGNYRYRFVRVQDEHTHIYERITA